MSRALRLLVVDDSALVRRTVTRLLEEDPALRVVGTAADGEEALREADRLRPDVVTLDVAMPVMDGLACLAELVRRFRQRVVLLSTLAREGSFTTYKALALGAVDFVVKPGADGGGPPLAALGVELRRKVWAAASVPTIRVGSLPPREPAPYPAPAKASTAPNAGTSPLRGGVVVGGSTGGTVALEALLSGLPRTFPAAVLAVQHLPPGFSTGFARYLDSVSGIPVKEGEEGEPVRAACAYIAPGGRHLRVQPTRSGMVLRLDGTSADGDGYRPSIDALFCSSAVAWRDRAVGVLLSGMGRDGVAGMAAVRKLGGRTLAQDESSSVVYGMAGRAVERGAVEAVVPLGGLSIAVRRAALGGAS